MKLFRRHDDQEVFTWLTNEMKNTTFENICISVGLTRQEYKDEKVYMIRYGTLSKKTGDKLLRGVRRLMNN